ncbi:hypothetical protein KIPB_007812, partial [Kipferlia bialata]
LDLSGRQMKWKRVTFRTATPVLCYTNRPLPEIAGRAYGVNKQGSVVSFHEKTGWADTGCKLPAHNAYAHTEICSLGRLVVITNQGKDWHHWYAYDTISNEVTRHKDQSFGGDGGVFMPALAVKSVYEDQLHMLNPALIYPHPDCEWAICHHGDVDNRVTDSSYDYY